MQITDEIMDNIDDAYERKLPVREHVEALEKFLNEQLPRFSKASDHNVGGNHRPEGHHLPLRKGD